MMEGQFQTCPTQTSALSLISVPVSPRYLDGGVPGGGEEPLLPPAHLADGVVVAHQGVLTSPVRDRVEVAEGTETRSSHTASQSPTRLPVPLTCCCPRKNTPQFSPQPASDMRTAPGDERQRVRRGGHDGQTGDTLQLSTMLEKETLLWKSFISLENIFRLESGTKRHFQVPQWFFRNIS